MLISLDKIKRLKVFRILVCGLRIPYYFIVLRAHVSKRMGLSVDKEGNYIPWLTYPIIDFLDNVDFTGCSVFEFGSGSSSIWWAQKARCVTSVEMDIDWYKKMLQMVPDNVSILSVSNGGQYPGAILNYDEAFDVIVVDGAERYQCVVNAIDKVSNKGVIILDNVDWYPNAAKLLSNKGFVQLDFYGHSPNNSFPSISSLFFKSIDLIGNRMEKTKEVIGGNIIKGGALDDG